MWTTVFFQKIIPHIYSSEVPTLFQIGFPICFFQLNPTNLKKIKWYAHAGFGNAWKSANDEIMQNLLQELEFHPSNSVTIAGHSFGGAMAILSAEDFHFRTGKKADVVTMGCPRITYGNKSREYLISCMNTIKQYENYNDIVPKVPFFYKNLRSIKVGEKFNLFKMFSNVIHFHCSYENCE